MEQSKSNRKIKNAISKLMFMLLFIITAISITTVSTHAASSKSNAVDGSGVTDMNGTDSGTGSNRGGLYYAGSVHRSGFLFMIVDNDGKPITYERYLEPKEAEDNGIELYDAVTFRIVQPEMKEELKKVHIESYVTHFGEVNSFSGHVYEDAPAPVIDNGPNWSGNSKGLEEWLFKQREYSGKSIDNWQYIVLKELSEQSPELAGKVLKDLMTDEEVNLAIEPITIHAGYDWTEWSEEDWNANAAVHLANDKDIDYDYYSNKENNFWRGKPFILTNTVNLGEEGIISGDNRILRVCSTGMYSATLIHRVGDALGRPVDDTGGKNWKWVNETLPFCIRLESDQLGITAVGSGSPERLPYGTIGNPNLGYSLVLFRAELKQAKIHSYNILDNPNKPDHCELPDSSRNTDGIVTIKKVYYTYKRNSVSSSVSLQVTRQYVPKVLETKAYSVIIV